MNKIAFEKRRKGTVTTPLGFLASGLRSGIKQKKKYDSALIVSRGPAVASGTFTTNKAKAWPVIYSMKVIDGPRHRAILASSGNANCFNGPEGRLAVQQAVESKGFGVVRDYVGHGIGQEIHEDPQVPNFGRAGQGPRIEPGLVLAIEPMVTAGGYAVETLRDGWTVVTKDRSWTSHYEDTVAFTENGPVNLTGGREG